MFEGYFLFLITTYKLKTNKLSYDNKALKTIDIILLTSTAASALVLSGFILGIINDANRIDTTENRLWASFTGAIFGVVSVCSSKFDVAEINEQTILENCWSFSLRNEQPM